MGSLLFVAVESLRRSRVTLVMLLAAVMAAVGLQIANASNLSGYSAELFEKGVVNSVGHLVVSPHGTEPLDGVSASLAELRKLDFVRHLTARLERGGVIFNADVNLPVRVMGIDPVAEQEARDFCGRIAQGQCLPPGEPRQIVVGSGVASHLGLSIGDRVRLVLPYVDLGELEHVKGTFTVGGVLGRSGGFSLVEYAVFVRAQALYELLDSERDSATVVHVFVDDPSRVAEYVPELARVVPNARVRPWWEMDDFIKATIDGNRTISAVSMAMVLLAVLIPVLALLSIQVLHERRQIATLAAIGFSRAALFAIYLLKAAVVGLVGSALGMGLGLLLCAYFERHPLFSFQGFIVRPVLDWANLLIPALAVAVVTLVGGLLPALRAARANPSLEMRER